MNKGFSIIEIIISIAIISMVGFTISTFQRDVFSLNNTMQSNLNAQLDARHIVKVMVSEIRESSPSNTGSYPIALASSTGMTFYSDINNDGLKEQVRYFLNGNKITKGVIIPSGTPLSYNNSNESFSTVISDFVASSTLPLFQYYPSSYNGSGNPLNQPVNILSVRLIKINIIIDRDPYKSPSPIITTSEVSIRNLKDNL